MKKITKKILSVLCAVLILAASVGTLAACGDGTSDTKNETKYKLSDYFAFTNGQDITEAEKSSSNIRIIGNLKCLKDVRILSYSFTAVEMRDGNTTPQEFGYTNLKEEHKAGDLIIQESNYDKVCNLKIEFEPL